MDQDGQRLLDVINDPNALESFLEGRNLCLESAFGHQPQQLMAQSLHTLQQSQNVILSNQFIQTAGQASPHQAASPFSQAAASPAAITQYSVQSPAPAPVASPQLYRAVASPQQQRSLSSTPVPSPINYPPGPGPGATVGTSVQGQSVLQTGTITLPLPLTAMGQVQQLVSGQVLQFLTAPTAPVPTVVTQQPPAKAVVAARHKQPQLRPKPAQNVNSPSNSPRPRPPAPPTPVQPQQQPQQVVINPASSVGQGTLLLNQIFPALAPTGGQLYLQQQGGGFQLVVRPPTVSQPVSSPKSQQQPQQQQQPAIVMQPSMASAAPTVVSTNMMNRPPHQPILQQQPVLQQQPLVRLVTLPGLGSVQLQQIQTANGPAFLALPQQPVQAVNQVIRTITSVPQAQMVHHHQLQQQATTIQQQQQPQQQTPQVQIQVHKPENSSESAAETFATPPAKAPKKKAKKKKKDEESQDSSKKRTQLNLEELLKESGIVDDDINFFEETSSDTTAATHCSSQEGNSRGLNDGEVLSNDIHESNLLQTLEQHGVNVSAEEFEKLQCFVKINDSALGSTELTQNGVLRARENDSNGSKGLCFTLNNGHVVQLGDQPKQEVTSAAAAGCAAAVQEGSPASHGFQNSFLEHLARSQIVAEPKKTKAKPATSKSKKKKTPADTKKVGPQELTPALTAAAVPAVTDLQLTAKPTVVSAVSSESSSTTVTQPATVIATPALGTPTMMPRVQTYQLSPQSQQSLRNIQNQIQYLMSKDKTPQEQTLLQKLIQHQHKILASGIQVPTVPGQHAQGIQFVASSGADGESGVRYAIPTSIIATQQPTQVTITGTTATIGSQQLVVVPKPAASGASMQPVSTPVGTLVLTVLNEQPAINSGEIPTPVATSAAPTVAPPAAQAAATSRGFKRPAVPPPKLSKGALFEHQLKTDQNGALNPDCNTPFKNKSSACKRLVRYHVFHELDPSPAELMKEEEELEYKAEQLLGKFRQMLNKYHYLLLMESTKEAPASEYVMVERMFVAEEKQALDRLKEEARVAKELQLTPVNPAWTVKTEPGETLANGQDQSAANAEDVSTPKLTRLKLTRKEGEGYRTELKEVQISMKESDRSDETSRLYDEYEGIRNELAHYAGAHDEDNAIYDDVINAQVQNAIDSILSLQRCEEGAQGPNGYVRAVERPPPDPMDFSLADQYGDMQVDLALNEAVKSIL